MICQGTFITKLQLLVYNTDNYLLKNICTLYLKYGYKHLYTKFCFYMYTSLSLNGFHLDPKLEAKHFKIVRIHSKLFDFLRKLLIHI